MNLVLLSAALLVFICSWLPSSFVGMWFVVAIIYIALPFGLGGLLEYVLRVVLTRRQHLGSFKMLIQRCNCTAFFLAREYALLHSCCLWQTIRLIGRQSPPFAGHDKKYIRLDRLNFGCMYWCLT